MSRTLLAYSTTDGHTPRICQRLADVLEEHGQTVTVAPLGQADALAPESYDQIVIGASIRYGKHQPQVAQFIARHQLLLENRPCGFFSVNIVARKPEKNRPDTNPYLLKFLQQIRWKPALLEVFAGKLDYPRYRFFDRIMIQFIMLMTKGPTDPTAVIEFTDWQRVEAFGRQIAQAGKPH
jgi:menaquinone-dependent protoporphyrinogen oxidase